jgi:glutathione S-transferase
VKYDGAEGSTKWFSEVKPLLIEKNSAITLPYLLDGDKVISESDAICVHICLRYGKPELLGRNADEQVLLATVLGVFKDLHPNYIKLVYGGLEGTFEEGLKESK